VRRKQLELEEIKLSRNRKRLMARALLELETGKSVSVNKKPRRQSRPLHIENEDALEEILIKVHTAKVEC
jgi:hypothetical protein